MVKKCMGTPKHNSKIEKLRKIFESSPTRRRAELLTHLSQPTCKQIKFNLSGQTTTTESVGLTQKICVGQPEGMTGTGPRQDCELGPEPSQDWTTPTYQGTVGPIRRTS